MRIVLFRAALVVTCLAAGPAHAGWLPLDPWVEGDAPETTLIEADTTGVTLEIRVPGLETGVSDDGEYAVLSLPGGGVTADVGAPLLPVLREALRLPEGATPELTVLATETESTPLVALDLPGQIWPAQAPVPKLPGAREAAPFAWDPDAYALEGLDPDGWASLGEIGQLRAVRLVPLEVFPARYRPATGEVELLRRIELRIDFVDADWAATTAVRERYATADHESFAARHLIAGGPLAARARVELPMGYLIIAHDSLVDSVRDLAGFRHRQGFDVTLVSLSQIPNGSNAASVRAYIQDAYHGWDVPPAFVLLVGDTGQIPATNGQHCYSATDLTFSTMDGGNDWLPDVYIGRFPAATATDATRMATKTLDYARFTLGGGDDWILDATFMASVDNHHISENTHNYCVSHWLEPGGYDCTKRYYNQGATTWQVLDDINAGLSQLTYSGHGYTQGWSDGPPLDASDLGGLVNAGKLPVVQSYACYTGDFASHSFGEAWLEASNGAVAFWGSSQTSYWDEDDILQRAAYDAWFGGGYHWFRGSLNEGLWAVNQAYGGGGYSRAYYEQFNLLGDPALDVWTSPPGTLEVAHKGQVSPSDHGYPVDVSAAGGAPIADALVCLSLEGVLHAAAYTDGAGHVEIPLDAELPAGQFLELTVSAHDFVPWSDGVPVSDPGAGDDDDDGDDDDADDDDGGRGGQGETKIDAGCQCRGDAGGAGGAGWLLVIAAAGMVVIRRRAR